MGAALTRVLSALNGLDKSRHSSLPATFLAGAVSIAFGLTLVSLLAHGLGFATGLSALKEEFNVDQEGNIPSWYSSSLLLISALIVGVVACLTWSKRGEYRLHWFLLSALLVGASVDESASLHELVNGPLHRSIGTGGILYYGWVIPAFGVVICLAALYRPFLGHLPARTFRLITSAAALYVGSALGLELLESALTDHGGGESLVLIISRHVEEFGELLGVSLFGYAVLDYMFVHLAPVPAAPMRESSRRQGYARLVARSLGLPLLLAGASLVAVATVAPWERDQAAALSREPVRFAVKGDWGSGRPEQSLVTQKLCEWRQRSPFSLLLTTGDNFYDPDGRATDGNFYGPEACLLGANRVSWRPAWGNHDTPHADTQTMLDAPGGPRYYSWRSNDVEFFVYDGNEATVNQTLWLRERVCSSNARAKVIYGHQPAYSVGHHGSDLRVRDMVHAVARDCGVKLVISGHDHLYMRSTPIDGVTYVVTGGGGSGLYECRLSEPWVASCMSAYHFLYVDVADGVFTVTAVAYTGLILDAFTLQ